MLKMFKHLTAVVITLLAMQANAGLIFYSDQTSFSSAVDSALAFEGFEDKQLEFLQVESGYIRYRTTSSLVSEGEKALVLKESNSVTFNFDHDVYAFGFFVNELNSTNLDYQDSAGNELLNALEITDVWNASTFFGVTSDVAITSFTLIGTGASTALYGIDALQFTSASVDEPSTWLLFSLALIILLIRIKMSTKHR